MATYERSTRVDAPLEEVWEFHVRPEGLAAVTPGWMNLRVEAVRGPDGDPDPEYLVAGSEVILSMRPFGVGPRQRWTSRIVESTRDDRAARFRDVMVEGPFARWEHTHRFVAADGGTHVLDRVDWALPGGPLGEGLALLGTVGMAPTFRYRHRKTRALLGDG